MSNQIELIVGLGNPGADYDHTRHNAGAWLVEQLADDAACSLSNEKKFHGLSGKIRISNKQIRILIPITFMNHSGRAVAAIANYYKLKPNQILIAHDELDLPPGVSRLKHNGGHGGHNGLRDIISALGSKEFYRLRIGIGHPGHKDKVHNYVLGCPSTRDKNQITDSINQVCAVLPSIIEGDHEKAMRQLHQKGEN